MRVAPNRLAAGIVSAGLATAALAPAAAADAPAPARTATTNQPATPPAAILPDSAPKAATPPPASTTPAPPADPSAPLVLEEQQPPRALEDLGQRPTQAPKKPRARKPAKADDDPAPATSDATAATAPPPGPAAEALAAIPADARAGVPSYFIDSFRIPVFLLPIYQAAGTEYGVRWEILAAINEIETDYGRNLNVSTAGALGWMQFMPTTWASYGVDANRDGRADPYNPVDAIFAAARYLQAAGAQTDLRKALFAYNHANWYVDSVLERAQRLTALPADLVGALTGLARGRSPVLGKARALAPLSERSRSLRLSVRDGAPVVAVADARVTRIGYTPRLGRYVRVQDVFGNTYTYGRLASFAQRFPVLRPARSVTAAAGSAATAQDAPPAPGAPGGAAPPAAATPAAQAAPTPPIAVQDPAAGAPIAPGGPSAPIATGDPGAASRAVALVARIAGPLAALDWAARARRFGIGVPAEPVRRKIAAPSKRATLYDRRLLGGVAASRVTYRRLREGSRVVAGTILGHAERPATRPARLRFEIRPAGRTTARIDPAPIVAGWKLLQTSSQGATSLGLTGQPSIGQVLLLSRSALQRLVLENRRIAIYPCGREDIRAGRVDRRGLATLQLLAMSGLSPTVSSLQCGHSRLTASGNVSEHWSGNAVDISAINGVPILGNQGAGSITDTTIRKLLTLQGSMQPHQIISLMTYEGVANTMALADHADHIHVGFAPLHAPGSLAARMFDGVLEPKAWQRLIDRLATIDNPRVATAPSAAALPAAAAP